MTSWVIAQDVTLPLPGWRNWSDAPDLKSGAFGHAGSSPAPGTPDGCGFYVRLRRRRAINVPAAATPASAAVTRFVWTHVRQALQQPVAAGATSAYLAAA